MTDAAYHHGDLRAALLREAERELAEKGLAKFSLRGVAKRAGVSHAAPAHHFGDVDGLLTALAARGFERMLEAQAKREAAAAPDPRSQFVAMGLGYIDFALASPALFHLVFASDRVDRTSEVFGGPGAAAFNHLRDGVRAVTGRDPEADHAAMIDLSAAWAAVHGLANLMSLGRPIYLMRLPPDERDAAVAEIISRSV